MTALKRAALVVLLGAAAPVGAARDASVALRQEPVGFSGAGPAGVRAFVEPARVALGDRFHLVVEVRHPPGHMVVLPKRIVFGDVESAGPVQSAVNTDPQGQVVETFRFPLQAFKLGTLSTPALELGIPGLSGTAGEHLQVDALSVDVLGVAKTKDVPMEPAPMATTQPLMREDPRFLAWPPLLLMHGLLWWAVLWLDRRRPTFFEARRMVLPPSLPPHRVALEKLEALKKSGLMETGRYSQFVDAAVYIVREYLERAYSVPVLEQTTDEAVRGLGPAAVRAALAEETRRLGRLSLDVVRQALGFADLVKFARVQAQVADCVRTLEAVVQIIETTRPLGPAPAKDGGG
jgi:hypothetical protein